MACGTLTEPRERCASSASRAACTAATNWMVPRTDSRVSAEKLALIVSIN